MHFSASVFLPVPAFLAIILELRGKLQVLALDKRIIPFLEWYLLSHIYKFPVQMVKRDNSGGGGEAVANRVTSPILQVAVQRADSVQLGDPTEHGQLSIKWTFQT